MPSLNRLSLLGRILLILLSLSWVVGEFLDWDQLKYELNGAEPESAYKKISKNWVERPDGFFTGIKEEFWEIIIPLLSQAKMSTVKAKELEENEAARRAFAKYLPVLSKTFELPESFRDEVYLQIKNENTERVAKLIGFIPESWIGKDGPKVTNALIWSSHPPRLHLLSSSALTALLKNPKRACEPISIKDFNSFHQQQLKLMTPSCITAIKELEKIDLSLKLIVMRPDIFAEYDGALSQSTIEQLSSNQLFTFGSLIDENITICKSLDLQYLRAPVSGWISARCLYGYLSRQSKEPLKDIWSTVPIGILMQFTPAMQPIWGNISLEDFSGMESVKRLLILSSPLACAKLSLSNLNLLMIKDFSAPCLEAFLSQSGGPFKLKELWMGISPATMTALTEKMMSALGNVHPGDISSMPPWVLQIFLQSQAVLDNLSNWTEPIELDSTARLVVLTSKQFAKLAKVAPNVAGQLLLMAHNFPDNILAECDGSIIRSLTFILPGKIHLKWEELFETLKAKNRRFDKIIDSMSTGAVLNFTFNVKYFREYLSIPWLYRKFGPLAALGPLFDEISQSLITTGISPDDLPWDIMLERLDLPMWTLIFQDEKLTEILGGICEFWTCINDDYPDLFKLVDRKALSSISPHCVPKLSKILLNNAQLIPLLADDAFATHQLGQLPCTLRELSVEQISKLSRHTIVDWNNPTAEEISQHPVANVTLEELRSLDFTRFSALFASQWIYVPSTIKSVALEWNFGWIKSILSMYIGGLSSNGSSILEIDSSSLTDALELVGTAYLGDPKVKPDLDLIELLPIIRQSNARDRFLEVFQKKTLSLEPYLLGLVKNSRELYQHLKNSIKSLSSVERRLEGITFNPEHHGFDRFALLSLIRSCPEALADPRARISTPGTKRRSKLLMRLLTVQILSDIRRDFFTSRSIMAPNGGAQVKQEADLFSPTGIEDEVGLTSQSGILDMKEGHFSWGVGKEAGLIVGIALAKAIQLKIKLPFVLDQEFYALLTDANDEALEEYHWKIHSQDKTCILEYFLSFQKVYESSPGSVDVFLPKLDRTRFITLNTDFDPEADKNYSNTFPIKTEGQSLAENFFVCPEQECAKTLENYANGHFRVVLAAFKEFIREVVRGFGLGVPLMSELLKMPKPVVQPVGLYLSTLLNASSIQGPLLFKQIQFFGNKEIKSLVDGSLTLTLKVVSAFINSLSLRQLVHLVHVWTGIPKISVEYTKFFVTFTSLLPQIFIKFDFCESPLQTKAINGHPTFMIAPGQEYRAFYSKVSKTLLGSSGNIEPNCQEGGVEFIPIKVSIEKKHLFIALQPAQAMINSLVYLVNTPQRAILQSFDP